MLLKQKKVKFTNPAINQQVLAHVHVSLKPKQNVIQTWPILPDAVETLIAAFKS